MAAPSEIIYLIDLIENQTEIKYNEIINILKSMKISEINKVYENQDGSFYTILDKAHDIAKKRLTGSLQHKITMFIRQSKRGLLAAEMLAGKGEDPFYKNGNTSPSIRNLGIAGFKRSPVTNGHTISGGRTISDRTIRRRKRQTLKTRSRRSR